MSKRAAGTSTGSQEVVGDDKSGSKKLRAAKSGATQPLRLRELGDPLLRVRGVEVAESRFGTAELTALCDGLIEVMRKANGAGIAAPQVGIADRIFVVHGTGENPRYPYKPPIPLTIFVNPVLEVSGEQFDLIEGCLSVPGVRGQVRRYSKVSVTARRPDGSLLRVVAEGHAAGTLQHENDHLDGVLFPDIARPGPFGPEALMTWAAFDEHYKAAFLPAAMALRDQHPNGFRILPDSLASCRWA